MNRKQIKRRPLPVPFSFLHPEDPRLPFLMPAYRRMVRREAAGPGGHGVFNWSVDAAKQYRAYLAVDDQNRLAAGVRVSHDKDGYVLFSSAIVRPQHRGKGLLTALLRIAGASEFSRTPQKDHRAFVRVMPDGRPNMASLRAFERLGFRLKCVSSYQIEGTEQDRHLLANSVDGRIMTLELVAASSSFRA